MSEPSSSPFVLLDPGDRTGSRLDALDARQIAPALTDLDQSAAHYQPSEGLVAAVNDALSVGAPLLLTGEAGAGKTQVAHYLAWYFETALFALHVHGDTMVGDLFYRFDEVAYQHAASDPTRRDLERGHRDLEGFKHALVKRGKGPLWKAYEHPHSAVVLIDEIDKASRDFPNALLHALDQHEFYVKEIERKVRCNATLPVVVVTSNGERRLPGPFLRRCIAHHLEFDRQQVRRAVLARKDDFPNLDDEFCDAAIARLVELRGRALRRHPATGELLTWLAILSARGDVTRDVIATCALDQLPALSALVKDHDDRAALT